MLMLSNDGGAAEDGKISTPPYHLYARSHGTCGA